MINERVTRGPVVPARSLPLGTRLKRVIHAALDVLPMPAETRKRIKGCSGCQKRERWLNSLPSKLRRFRSTVKAALMPR